MSRQEGPFIHIYYGDGKGKTTAAIGQAVRAAGAGRRVAFVQFDKGPVDSDQHYSERKALRQIPGIEIYVTGRERLAPNGKFRTGVSRGDSQEAERGLRTAADLLRKNEHFLIVLDEILTASAFGLIPAGKVSDILRVCRDHFSGDLLVTGWEMPEGMQDEADLVTHFRKVKHYFDRGITGRVGIEM